MSTEIRPSGSSVPTMNSVEPPPTSRTRIRRRLGEARGGAAELEARFFLARDQLGPHADGRFGCARRTRRGWSASRDALVAVMRTRSTPSSSMHRAVLAQHHDGALDRVGMECAVGMHTLAEARDPRPAVDGVQRRRRARRGRRRGAASSWSRCRRPRRASRRSSRRAGPRPTGRPDRRRRRGGRRSARAGTSRRCGFRRPRPTAGGRRDRLASCRVALARVLGVCGEQFVAVDAALSGRVPRPSTRAARRAR